ncbi:preprotein translocase subunit YajC [Hymenobacter rubripertinctus]|uniref:Sec translocon accessory complex subunit YajC n=1 Tax=Hymenobacter rubripertinctus TaxID=2029981 RepID=A0A418R6K4_9BACT|nr:preprotein translocase subunit YajC [Hymenobacter rubripertinctus]RIY13036.1 preprotein translocase subunit YajC [Hymenobacter rubripertinctus]
MFATLLLQTPAGSGSLLSYLPIVGMAVVVYFFMIRPQQKRSADAKKFRAALGKGASVVTIGGLHGKVVDLSDETVTVEVDKGVRLRFDRSAIARETSLKTATPAA